MRGTNFTLLLSLVALLIWASPKAQAVIYEIDARLDIYELEEASPVRSVSDSVAAVVDTSELSWITSGAFLPDQVKTLRERKRVCSGVRYSEQPTMGFCSSFLIAPDLVVMARHCLAGAPCTRTNFVFDFTIKDPQGRELINLSPQEVYRCKSFSYPRDELGPTHDFTVVQLDRPVVGRAPLPLRLAPAPRTTSELYAVGHPNGLPQKVAPGGTVKVDRGSYFLTELDTFHGNSGSPVLNSETHEVEGVLIDGEADYVSRGGCRVPNVCLGDECQGEKVLNIFHVVDFLSE